MPSSCFTRARMSLALYYAKRSARIAGQGTLGSRASRSLPSARGRLKLAQPRNRQRQVSSARGLTAAGADENGMSRRRSPVTERSAGFGIFLGPVHFLRPVIFLGPVLGPVFTDRCRACAARRSRTDASAAGVLSPPTASLAGCARDERAAGGHVER